MSDDIRSLLLKNTLHRSKTYAGIGSRKTPVDVQNKMTEIAENLSRLGYVLYSGGAQGADSAFEKGATEKVIFLPWDGFNGRRANNLDYVVPPENLELVKRFHPKYDRLSTSAISLMSRNSYQVLGTDLRSPVEFVLCWTEDGKASGGTGQALRIAKHYDIPIFNIHHETDGIIKYIERIHFLTALYF